MCVGIYSFAAFLSFQINWVSIWHSEHDINVLRMPNINNEMLKRIVIT